MAVRQRRYLVPLQGERGDQTVSLRSIVLDEQDPGCVRLAGGDRRCVEAGRVHRVTGIVMRKRRSGDLPFVTQPLSPSVVPEKTNPVGSTRGVRREGADPWGWDDGTRRRTGVGAGAGVGSPVSCCTVTIVATPRGRSRRLGRCEPWHVRA